MKKSPRPKAPAAPRVDPYLEGLVGKLVERLVGLEKKMDAVLAQTAKLSGGADSSRLPAPQMPRRDRTLYEAVCADCSKVCEVPFRPTEDRPVYCKDCWARRKAGAAKTEHGMPVLTPVALPPKPAGKLGALLTPAAPRAPLSSQRAKKKQPVKKRKRK